MLVDVELEVELVVDELVPSIVVEVLDDDVVVDELLIDELDDDVDDDEDDDGPVDVVVELKVSQSQNCLETICTGAFPRGDDMNCAYCGPAHDTPCNVTKISCPGANAYVL